MSRQHFASETRDNKEVKLDIFKAGLWKKRIIPTPTGKPELGPLFAGKVYIRREGGSEILLEHARFSNIDLNIYEGNELKSEFTGKKWSLKFKTKEKDRFGKEYEFNSSLLSPVGFGKVGEIDWKSIPGAEQIQADLAVSTGALTGYHDSYLQTVLGRGGASLMVLMSPGKTLEEIKPLIWFITFCFLYDDQIDDNSEFACTLSFDQIQKIRTRIMHVLHTGSDPDQQETLEFPGFLPLCRIMYFLHNSITKQASPEIAKEFFTTFDWAGNTAGLSNCKEWRDFKKHCKTGTPQRAYWELRRYESGYVAVLEAVLLTHKIILPVGITRGYLWPYFKHRCADYLALLNDLFSFKKECIEGTTTNSVYIRHYYQNQDIASALENCVKDVNDCATDLIELQQVLLKIHEKENEPNKKELSRGIHLLQSVCLTHLIWYCDIFSPLYRHTGLVFDAVLDLDASTV